MPIASRIELLFPGCAGLFAAMTAPIPADGKAPDYLTKNLLGGQMGGTGKGGIDENGEKPDAATVGFRCSLNFPGMDSAFDA